jgi:hypothetical protein
MQADREQNKVEIVLVPDARVARPSRFCSPWRFLRQLVRPFERPVVDFFLLVDEAQLAIEPRSKSFSIRDIK